ncbi:MAG: hypothetical protein ACLFTQ_00150 [Candidatus Aenigmatarchaeota archaeon]
MVNRESLKRNGYEHVDNFLDLEMWENEEKVKLYNPKSGAEVYTYEK